MAIGGLKCGLSLLNETTFNPSMASFKGEANSAFIFSFLEYCHKNKVLAFIEHCNVIENTSELPFFHFINKIFFQESAVPSLVLMYVFSVDVISALPRFPCRTLSRMCDCGRTKKLRRKKQYREPS